MSKLFTTIYLIKFLHNQPSNFKNTITLYLGTTGLFLHCYYTIITTKYTRIKVDKKYTFVRNGFTEFMIIDQNGKHYNVNNSFWYWKWNSIEDWHKIQTQSNVELNITRYGWRVPLFGVFPNIIISDI
jgi:hypothetical protein